ncbi:MAG: succinate dehydrogenase, hydrophobic membrane anchor protein [Gammaproteobacteria bacterium]
MVMSGTNFSNNGVRNWVMQRASAIINAILAIFLIAYLICHPQLSYQQWHHLFTNPWMQILFVLALLSIVVHAWIGIWRVTTDYITCPMLRISSQLAIIIALWGCFIWGIKIVWSM